LGAAIAGVCQHRWRGNDNQSADTVKAIRYYGYGSPDVLTLEDVEQPAVGDDDVLVQVRAAAANPLDFHFMRGSPYIMRTQSGLSKPKANGLGVDMAGTVAAVGKNVTTRNVGDEVFGGCVGAFAEYVGVRADAVIHAKPANLTFEQAAAVPVAGFTALQALRDKGQVQAGQRVLVNGAAGGVGTFAVQIAKVLGAEVTGVCSTRNVELVRSIGADHVIDYTIADFAGAGQRYDVVVDAVGNRTLAAMRRVLTPKGVLVGIAWRRPLLGPVTMLAVNPFVRQSISPLLAQQSRDDLVVLAGYLGAGTVTPVVDRTYSLGDVPAAMRYLEAGHARGKIVITV
jgi:NADPH:quinone reductase-like Zn-dependent oxidoreductase